MVNLIVQPATSSSFFYKKLFMMGSYQQRGPWRRSPPRFFSSHYRLKMRLEATLQKQMCMLLTCLANMDHQVLHLIWLFLPRVNILFENRIFGKRAFLSLEFPQFHLPPGLHHVKRQCYDWSDLRRSRNKE